MKTKFYFLISLFCASTALKAQTTLISEGFENVAALTAGTTTILTENFDNVAALPASGWSTLNTSIPIGLNGWFQGQASIMPSQSGAANSSIQANYNSVGNSTSALSNWLIAPTRLLQNGDVIKFWTRTYSTLRSDRLQVRLSTLGASSVAPSGPADVGSYSVLLTEINASEISGGYPLNYQEYNMTVSGLPAATNCRVAFRYFLTSGANANYIAIDSFSVKRNGPTTWSMYNNSYPSGSKDWYQSSDTQGLSEQAGTANSCINADNSNTTINYPTNSITNNWLITPPLLLQNGDIIKFWIQNLNFNFAATELIEIRYSTDGNESLAPNDTFGIGSYTNFQNLIYLNLNNGDPIIYTEHSIVLSGLPQLTNCRVALRYFVNGGSPTIPRIVTIDTFSITRPALSDSKFDLETKVTLSPNPVVDTFQLSLIDVIDASKLKIEIYDLNGRMIKNFKNSLSYSISDLDSGIYLVNISDGKIFETKKIVKN